MKKRAHRFHHGRRGVSYKTLGLGVAAGVAAILGAKFLADHVQAVRERWYAPPLLAAAGALLLAKKMPTIAVGLAAAGGVIGYIAYQANQSNPSKAAESASGLFGDAGYHQGRRMSVRGDSGLFDRSGNAGALMGAGAPTVAREQAGALMGSAARPVLRQQSAGFADAGTLGLDA